MPPSDRLELQRKSFRTLTAHQKTLAQYYPIHLEHIHWLFEVPTVSFSLYLKYDDELYERIPHFSFSHAELSEVLAKTSTPEGGYSLWLKKSEAGYYYKLIALQKQKYLEKLFKAQPQLESPLTLAFLSLSQLTPQLVFQGIEEGPWQLLRSQLSKLLTLTQDEKSQFPKLFSLLHAEPILQDQSALSCLTHLVLFEGQSLSLEQKYEICFASLLVDVAKTRPGNPLIELPVQGKPGIYKHNRDIPQESHDYLSSLLSQGLDLPITIPWAALEHREQYDGSGYPHARKGALETDAEHGILKLARVVNLGIAIQEELHLGFKSKSQQSLPEVVAKLAQTKPNSFDPGVLKEGFTATGTLIQLQKEKNSSKGKILIMDAGKLSKA